jgi:hypothetical protein
MGTLCSLGNGIANITEYQKDIDGEYALEKRKRIFFGVASFFYALFCYSA